MILVDYSQVAISTLMAQLRGQTDVEISTPLIRHMIINSLRSYKMKFGSDYGQLVIACDNKKYWRKTIFPFYKSNRKRARDDSGFDWHAIFEVLNQVKQEIAEYFPYPVIEATTAEADDVIASLVMWTQDNDLIAEGLDMVPQPVLILSGDHDFIQLQRHNNVRQYSPLHKKMIRTTETAHAVLMEHILVGDKGDGVPNFLSPDDVFASGGRQKPIRKKDLEIWKKLDVSNWDGTEHELNIKRNAQMVDLRLVPPDVRSDIISNYVQQKNVQNKTQLLNYFIAHKMKNLIEHLEEF